LVQLVVGKSSKAARSYTFMAIFPLLTMCLTTKQISVKTTSFCHGNMSRGNPIDFFVAKISPIGPRKGKKWSEA